MGKDLESLELAKELVAQKPTDLTVLGNLDKVFVTANDCIKDIYGPLIW